MNLLRRTIQLLLLIAWSVTVTARAQQASSQAHNRLEKSVSYGFVSPNRREDLTLAGAITRLNSRDEIKLIGETRRIASCVHLRTRVIKAVGSWSDGAEHSTIFRVNADEPTMRYAVSLLGRYARQKTVLYFRLNPAGNGRMYILVAKRRAGNLFSISSFLDRVGIKYRTLVPLGNRMLVYIVDLENVLREKTLLAAKRLGAKVTTTSGTGDFIGDDGDRKRAKQIFGHEIESYEESHVGSGECSPDQRRSDSLMPASHRLARLLAQITVQVVVDSRQLLA